MKIYKLLIIAGIIIFLLASWSREALSNSTDSIRIAFADVHTSDVTHMVVHPSGEYFFTGDVTGKILMWRTNDYTFYKTITEGGTARAIRGMGFRDNGRVLMVSQGVQGIYGIFDKRSIVNSEYLSLDSIVFYLPFENKLPVKTQLSFDILSHTNNNSFLCGVYQQGSSYIMAFDDGVTGQAFFQMPAEGIISSAAISKEKDRIAFAENMISDDFTIISRLKIYNRVNQESLFTKILDSKIIQLHFDNSSPELYVFTHNSEKKIVEVFSISLIDFTISNHQEFEFRGIEVEDASVLSEDNLYITVTSKNSWPIILTKGRSSFTKMDIPWSEIAYYKAIPTAALVPGRNHVVCWTPINSFFGTTPEMFVVDHEARTNILRYTQATRNRLKAYFLPENSWVVKGTEGYQSELLGSSINEFLKYYQWGTLSNRFGRLNFRDYMLIHHDINLGDYADFALDEHSGKVVFPASISSDMKFRDIYMVYDLLEDKVDTSFTTGVDLPMPISYSNSSERILTTHRADRSTYQVVSRNKVFDFRGDYTNAIISQSGEYIMLIDTKNLLKIYHVSSNKLKFEKLISGNDIRIGMIDDDNFWASYTYNTSDRIVNESLMLNYDDTKYSENVVQGFQILDIAYSNDVVAMVSKNWSVHIVTVGQKYLIFPGSVFPVSVSLDQPAQRMMLSMNNGTVRIYETGNLNLLGEMMHPDSKSHSIIDSLGYYSSNTSTPKLLHAESNGLPVALADVDIEYNRPQEMLKIFGEPDGEYLNLLTKTSEIRKRKIEKAGNNQFGLNSKPVISNLMIDGKNNLSFTDKQEVKIQFDINSGDSGIAEFGVFLNNVKVNPTDLKKANSSETVSRYELTLPLVHGENFVSLIATDSNDMQSDPINSYLVRKVKTEKPDLYILTIGVSDYLQTRYNLTYADKDAIDLAILYGDSTVVDMNNYMNKFFGQRYIVDSKDNNSEMDEIRLYEGVFSSLHDLFQVDYNGRFWLEKEGYDERYFIWDFESAERTQVKLPDVPSITIFYDVIIPLSDNTGFFYKSEGAEWYKFSFESHTASTFETPTGNKFFPLPDGKWATSKVIESSYEKGATVEISLLRNNSDQWNSDTFTVMLPGVFINTELVGVSGDGSRFVFEDHDRVFLVSKTDNDVNVQEIKGFVYDYGSIYQFTVDNGYLTRLNTHYDDKTGFSGFMYYKYNISSAKLDSSLIDNSGFAYKGLNNLGGQLRWVAAREPIAEMPDYSGRTIKERSEFKPVSFGSVHARVLTNEQATRQNVIENIENFLSAAHTNDQVMVFISGHGVLDKSFNYYFAPNDMDFTNPEVNGISYDTIIEQLKKSPSAKKLLIMDTCHSGDLFDIESVSHSDASNDDNSGRKGAALIQNESFYAGRVSDIIAMLFDNISSSSGITVLTASSGTDLAYESREHSNGALTTAFIESIEKGLRMLPINSEEILPQTLTDEFIYQLQKTVISTTQGKQIPNVREINKLSGIKLW
jgi:hypothetical protein